jgi:hypothetical protein
MSLLMLPLPGVYLSLAARRGWAKKELATDFTD